MYHRRCRHSLRARPAGPLGCRCARARLADAILGACRGGDIGKLFPDTDPAYEGADSMVLLARVMDYARELGFEFVDADCTIACQQPKITPHRDAMRANLAHAWALTSKTWASPPLRPKSSVGKAKARELAPGPSACYRKPLRSNECVSTTALPIKRKSSSPSSPARSACTCAAPRSTTTFTSATPARSSALT